MFSDNLHLIPLTVYLLPTTYNVELLILVTKCLLPKLVINIFLLDTCHRKY